MQNRKRERELFFDHRRGFDGFPTLHIYFLGQFVYSATLRVTMTLQMPTDKSLEGVSIPKKTTLYHINYKVMINLVCALCLGFGYTQQQQKIDT